MAGSAARLTIAAASKSAAEIPTRMPALSDRLAMSRSGPDGRRTPAGDTADSVGFAPMGRLEGKVAIVSGGARGQGAAEARLFAAEGARVMIGDVLDAEAEVTVKEIGPSAAF